MTGGARSRFVLLAACAFATSLAASCDDARAVMRDGTNAGLAGLEDLAERSPTSGEGTGAGGRPTANEIGDR
ncbi:MAG TPA: hypothetical protein VGK73_15900 [Polyangiaceae bacterium]